MVSDPAGVVTSRAGSSDGFRRTWLMRLHDTAEHLIRDITHPMHTGNADELGRDAVRRGLRPNGEVAVDAVEPRADGTTAVTYLLPVVPTENAVSVSTPTAPPAWPAPAVDVESTVEDTPAVDAPVPAAAVTVEWT